MPEITQLRLQQLMLVEDMYHPLRQEVLDAYRAHCPIADGPLTIDPQAADAGRLVIVTGQQDIEARLRQMLVSHENLRFAIEQGMIGKSVKTEAKAITSDARAMWRARWGVAFRGEAWSEMPRAMRERLVIEECSLLLWVACSAVRFGLARVAVECAAAGLSLLPGPLGYRVTNDSSA